MLNMKNITDVFSMQVFTDNGEYFGDIEEALLTSNKVSAWRIKATKSSFLSKLIGNAKGVIIPHHLVRAIGDIMIISKSAVPAYDDDDEMDDE